MCSGMSDLGSVDHVILYFQLRLPVQGLCISAYGRPTLYPLRSHPYRARAFHQGRAWHFEPLKGVICLPRQCLKCNIVFKFRITPLSQDRAPAMATAALRSAIPILVCGRRVEMMNAVMASLSPECDGMLPIFATPPSKPS